MANDILAQSLVIQSPKFALLTTLYITLASSALLFLVFAPVLIGPEALSEIRFIIIYFASLIIVLPQAINITNTKN